MTPEQQKTLEHQFHELLREKFLEAKGRLGQGEFQITITCSGYLNSTMARIETNVLVGEWATRGEMKAASITKAFGIALERARENKFHEVKLIEVRGDPA